MNLVVRESGSRKTISVPEGLSVAEALASCGVDAGGSCGGRGKCCRCDVFTRDESGLYYRLACQTPAREGMEIASIRTRDVDLGQYGTESVWNADGEGWGYGLAIDVGTTTIVCRLYDQETGALLQTVRRANPQLVFGAAVKKRIEACRRGKLKTMAKLLEEMLSEMTGVLASETGISPADINDIALCGNTVMELIAADIDPTPMGEPPYLPPTLFGEEIDYLTFVDSDITAGTAYFAPCISSSIGGDITCGLLAIDMARSEELMVYLDLGTNGEMVLGNKDGILACATTTGSVFEGASIKYGMPAYRGAVSRVRYDGTRLELGVIGDEEPLGICGSGIIDAIFLMLERGVLTSEGRILPPGAVDLSRSKGLERFLSKEDGAPCLKVTKTIAITQHDVEVFQAAKAGLAAGMQLMLKRRGAALEDVRELVVSGSLDDEATLVHATQLGMLPKRLHARVRSCGDAAIEGVSALLLSDEANDQIEKTIDICEYLELEGNEEFEELRAAALDFTV